MMIPPVTNGAWVALACAALCIGLAKGGLGGFGFISILIMASVFPARLSTGVVLLQLLVADLLAVKVFHQHANWRLIRRVMPPALFGVIAGWALMSVISDAIFRPVLGAIILGLAIMQFIRPRLGNWIERTRHSRAFAWGMGGAGGVTTMLANAAGPVMSLYFLAMRLPKMEFVGTSAWFFCLVNAFKIPFSVGLGLMPGWVAALCLLMSPLIFAGVLAGRMIVKRLSQGVFEFLVLLFAVLGGVRLLLG